MDRELKELIAFQYELGLGDVHLVHIGENNWWLAHTEEERASDDNLEECPFHTSLLRDIEPPVQPGIYVLRQPRMFTQFGNGPDSL